MKSLTKIDKKVILYRPLLEVKKFLIKISKKLLENILKIRQIKMTKYLRTKIRNLKKPLENSGIKYDQIFRSIKNLSISKNTLDEYLNKTFKD